MTQRKVHIFLFSILLLVMLTAVHHNYLWGPDEPREAEIARETLVENHWVTPYLCGLPFLEKPPLFYDTVAGCYALTGSVSPAVARSVSVFFGIVMLAGVFFLSRRLTGARSAWLSVFLLLAMPMFYAYSHLILLDIAVGAFCTVALVAFVFWMLHAGDDLRKTTLLCLFYLACAGAFLSKGLIGIFHIALILGAFCLITRRWQVLGRLVFSFPIFVFIIPAAVWIFLFYREGGVGYLHEHFVNNTIGRLMHIHFAVPGSQFYHTDLGNQETWYFYIAKLPEIFGPVILIFSLAVWDTAKAALKTTRQQNETCDLHKDVWMFLLIWAILPAIVLSFSAIKEKSYILPSYSAIAIMAGLWLDRKLPTTEKGKWQGIGWLLIAAAIAIFTIFLSWINVRTYLIITVSFVSLSIPFLPILLHRRRFNQVCFLLIAVVICWTIIYRSPNVRYHSNNALSALPLTREVWTKVGDAPLYLYRPKDIIRGSIAFYGNRTISEIDLPTDLRSILVSPRKQFILTDSRNLKSIQAEPSLRNIYTVQTLTDTSLGRPYLLLTNDVKR